MKRDDQIEALIGRILPAARELSVTLSRASWEQSTTGSPAAARRTAALGQELRTYYSDPQVFAEIRQLRAEADSTDPVLRRELEQLYRSYLANQITPDEVRETVERETELRQLFLSFRASLRGRQVTDNELNEVLLTGLDADLRRDAWLASKQIGVQAAPQVRELARLRNRIARRLGFRDYFAMQLEAQEIDEGELLQVLDGLLAASDGAFRAEKADLDQELAGRFGIAPDQVAPWHYSDPFFQNAPHGAGGPDPDRYFRALDVAAAGLAFYDGLGLEVRDVLARSDLYERPGKSQSGFCMNIDRQGDVRILVNLKPNERWMSSLLHELGHAAYEKYVDPGIPWLLRRAAHTMTTEAIAQLMGRLTKNARWLAAYAGVPESEAQAAEAWLHLQERRDQLIFTRWGMVVTHFERGLYADPDQDLGGLWWSLVERLQHVQRPDAGDRSADWAAKIHIACHPVYYHNYVLGEMTASQLQAALVRDLGPAWMLSDETGAWLWKRIFRPGGLLPWNERLAAATGERLNSRHFVEQFARA